MSKRKRNRKSSVSKQPQLQPSASSARSSRGETPKRKRDQRGLLLLAAALLIAAIGLNVHRWTQDQPTPGPLPLPDVEIVSRPLATPSIGPSTRFTALSPAQTGVEFVHPVIEDHRMAFLYFSSTAAGGTAVGDVNSDGRPDLFVASGPVENRLYIQTDQPFQFADVTEQAGVDGGDAWACGATMVDINADGRLDIYVANYDSPNQLFVNQGDGSFENRAAEYGLNITDASLEAVFADYDRDGFLDMYLVTYRYENPDGMPLESPVIQSGSKKVIRPELDKYYEVTDDEIGYGVVGRSDGLLRNNGDGTFSNVTTDAGIEGFGHGQSATWWDFNGDGFVDLYVGNDFNDADRLYRNNGDGTFTDVIRQSVPHTTWFSMGADAGDVNGDGLIDLLSTDMSSTTHFKQKTTMGSMSDNVAFLTQAVPRQYMRNALLINSGVDRFKEAAYLSGLDSTDWTWSAQLLDLDCDGRLDALFTNGSVRSFTDSDRTLPLSQRRGKTEWELYKNTEPLREENLAFRNDGKLQFTNVSREWGLSHLGVSMSDAYADFDGDGDLDLVVANVDEPMAIYRNDTEENNRISIRLHGRGGNRFGIGATIRITAAGGQQIRELYPSRGFLACNEPHAFFGCGDDQTVDLEITWPDGQLQSFSSLATGSHYEILEPDGAGMPRRPASGSAMFETKSWANVRHTENEFDDYQLQPLLPHRMSRLGPALAAGDIDGDDDFDLFLGGASGTSGQILVRDEESKAFVPKECSALAEDAFAEDMGAVWLDADGDGDLDLFATGGGNEHAADSHACSMRLYLNDGEGNLTRSNDRIPELRESAGPVSAADFDQDGDVDLFVGGRQVPGQYPLPARSYVLVNDDGRFSDRTVEVAAGVSNLGMVTGSLWSDVDNDHDLDLLVTTEWGPLHLFRNHNGMLSDESASAGLTVYRGWWTGITGGDLDADGDIDYVATNLGLNTKYHASDEHPYRLYYGDFEGDGQRSLVEAEYEDETLFPVRGKSCSTHAMPSLGTKFPTYREFAAATLQEIYTPRCLDESYQCSANYLRSAVLLNDGNGHFTVQSLPVEAQLAPCFGVVITEITGDGVLDLFIAQNFFSPQPETGNMDGGLGCILIGRGDGSFSTMATRDSGVVIPEDAKAAVLAELNRDRIPDFVVATNNGALKSIESRIGAHPSDRSSRLKVTVDGARSCSEIAGTRISLWSGEKLVQLIEVSSGSGYLSQQPPVFYLANPHQAGGKILVRFPNGTLVERTVDADEEEIRIVR